jgi:hypothetical protein
MMIASIHVEQNQNICEVTENTEVIMPTAHCLRQSVSTSLI